MTESLINPKQEVPICNKKPIRLGFIGIGWIGQNRLEAIARSGLAEISLLCDLSPDALERCLAFAPGARSARCFDDLLDSDIDGVVIATPSAQHAPQAEQALERGLAVFCQKPLGRTTQETLHVVEAARTADRLLSVDFSYRFTRALQTVRSVACSGALGEIFAGNFVFHNAYGPDKSWFYNRELSGGGCVIDLGIHLADAALWLLDFPKVKVVHSRRYAQGHCLDRAQNQVEDYATAQIVSDSGVIIDMACSWRLSAGQDCIISMELFGTRGAVAFRNVNGSFYDFLAERYEGTMHFPLVSPPDNWQGQAAVDWVRRLASGERFDPANQQFIHIAKVLDEIYAD